MGTLRALPVALPTFLVPCLSRVKAFVPIGCTHELDTTDQNTPGACTWVPCGFLFDFSRCYTTVFIPPLLLPFRLLLVRSQKIH